jgi:cytochrome b
MVIMIIAILIACVVSGGLMSSYFRQSDYWGNQYQATLNSSHESRSSKFHKLGMRALGFTILFAALTILLIYLKLR